MNDPVQPMRETPDDLWIGRYDRGATHIPALCAAVDLCCGGPDGIQPRDLQVLEIGGGFNSTAVLHAMCRTFTFESDAAWVDVCRKLTPRPDRILHDPDWSKLDAHLPDDVDGVYHIAFVDHWGDSGSRSDTVRKVKSKACIVVVHDADDAWMAENRELVDSFASWRRYERLDPPTLIASDTLDLSGMVL